jgi:hypothetical protein
MRRDSEKKPIQSMLTYNILISYKRSKYIRELMHAQGQTTPRKIEGVEMEAVLVNTEQRYAATCALQRSLHNRGYANWKMHR